MLFRSERVVHRRREEREAEARARAQERDGGERRRGVERERVDDVRLDRLEIKNSACTNESDTLYNTASASLF